MRLTHVRQLIRQAVVAWIDDYAPSMGAALAYYTLFSIAPLLIIVIALAGAVFGHDAVRGEVAAQISGLIGPQGARAIEGLIESASEPRRGIVAAVASSVMLLVGATTVFAELQSALDRIWRVPAAKASSGIPGLLRARLFSFGLVLGLGFLVLVSLLASAAIAAVSDWWKSISPGSQLLVHAVNIGVSFTLITLVFAMIYKIMPRARIAWSDVWVGAVVTAFLFEVGKSLIGLYLGTTAVASGFGAAGSIVVLLVWVYYSAQIFLLGAEFTWVYAEKHGSRAAARPGPERTRMRPPGSDLLARSSLPTT